ncbi:MAG: hypothetical protein ACLSGW_05755 [Clostridium sp.]
MDNVKKGNDDKKKYFIFESKAAGIFDERRKRKQLLHLVSDGKRQRIS